MKYPSTQFTIFCILGLSVFNSYLQFICKRRARFILKVLSFFDNVHFPFLYLKRAHKIWANVFAVSKKGSSKTIYSYQDFFSKYYYFKKIVMIL